MARGIFILKRANFLRIFLLSLLLLSSLKGGEYVFWARLEMRDFALSFNEINILPAMSSTTHPTLEQICAIRLDNVNKFLLDDMIKLELLNSKKNELFECFLSQQSRISSWSELLNSNTSTRLKW